MSRPAFGNFKILVVAESTTNASLVKKLLEEEFEHVSATGRPEDGAAEFDRLQPDVLVLAFGNLEKAERHNLGLFRQSEWIHQRPHRTIVLCAKDEVLRAYSLCREGIFDDYILFWPIAQDATRLPMAVHQALCALATGRGSEPTPMEFVTEVRRVAELEPNLHQQLSKGEDRIEAAGRALARAQENIGTAILGFSQRLMEGDLSSLVEVRNAKALEHAFDHLNHESVRPPLTEASGAIQPLKEWAEEFRQECKECFEPIRSLQALAGQIRPTVMVVDDDEFQHKIVSRLLKDQGFRLVFAASGIEAMNMLRKQRPDLILLDLSMPGMDGLDVTRRVKGVAQFANIPIIMVTGNSEEAVVTDCLAAGAADFMVKPFFKETLTEKIAKAMSMVGSPKVESPPDLSQSDL